ncbi:uncharacterized protein LOC132057964 [Lycium ferocissimum]|uniref:uncharacterized protein LOC132057964 n=1 Tax=Lycium ferocissimum TaxID=112874 RepID=UPI0028151E5B|nr:uncharacterized protein LOC132057964 [Lycium ferocissimum]
MSKLLADYLHAQKLAQIYIRKIVHLRGVPISIISNRGTQFISQFWRTLQTELGTQLYVNTTFHLQTDGQSERSIQVLEDMLRACVIDFVGHWYQFLPLVEFAYNNSYHSSIDMVTFEALFGRRCRFPNGRFDAFDVRPWGTDLLRESLDKVKVIQDKLLAAPRFKGPFEILDRVGEATYELTLPPGLFDVHPVFHVSMLKRYHSDGSFIIHWDSILLDDNLSYEEDPIVILDREVHKLRSNEVEDAESLAQVRDMMKQIVEHNTLVREQTAELGKAIERIHVKLTEMQAESETCNNLQVTGLANTQDEPQIEEKSEFLQGDNF